MSTIFTVISSSHTCLPISKIPKTADARTSELNIQNVIYLKHSLALVSPIRECLTGSEDPLLTAFHEALGDARFRSLALKIDAVIAPEAHYQRGGLDSRLQKIFAVSPNVNGLIVVGTYIGT